MKTCKCGNKYDPRDPHGQYWHPGKCYECFKKYDKNNIANQISDLMNQKPIRPKDSLADKIADFMD